MKMMVKNMHGSRVIEREKITTTPEGATVPPTALELQSRFQVRIPRASVETMRKLQKILAYDEDNDGVARMEVADDHTLDTNAHKQWLLF